MIHALATQLVPHAGVPADVLAGQGHPALAADTLLAPPLMVLADDTGSPAQSPTPGAAPCTSAPYGPRAVGDCTAKLMLAHVAEAQGIVVAETLAGADTMPVDYDFVPRATYCHPQIGSFGYSEAQAKERGYDVKTATFPFTANGKAMGLGDAVGFVKVVADATHNEILGAHMIGPDVTELLPVLTLAQKWDLTADEVARNVFAHPTLSEAVKEAVEGIVGHMINF
jgi:dihydrolipoamide dehydrogenase